MRPVKFLAVSFLVVSFAVSAFSISNPNYDLSFRRVAVPNLGILEIQKTVLTDVSEAGFTALAEGDAYFTLTKGGVEFAHVRENKDLGILEVIPIHGTRMTLEDVSMATLEYVYQEYISQGRAVQVLSPAGNEIDILFSSRRQWNFGDSNIISEDSRVGGFHVTKEWQGREAKFFQMMLTPEGGRTTAVVTFNYESEYGVPTMIVRPEQWVWINGAGTVGALIGQAARNAGYRVAVSKASIKPDTYNLAINQGHRMVALNSEQRDAFAAAGIPVMEGTIMDFAGSHRPIVIDATPGKEKKPLKIDGKEYKSWGQYYQQTIYQPLGLRAVFQGGDISSIAPLFSTVASDFVILEANSDVRAGSCNTTSTLAVVTPLLEAGYNITVRGVYVRRDTDIGESKGIHGLEVEPGSHHWSDVQFSLSDELGTHLLGIDSIAVKTPQQFSHVITLMINGEGLNAQVVTDLLKDDPRLVILTDKKMLTTDIEGQLRNQLEITHYYLPVIEIVDGNIPGEVHVIINVPQESVIVPNNVGIIEAMTGHFSQPVAEALINEVVGLNRIRRYLRLINPTP